MQEKNNGKKSVLITDTMPLYPPLWGGPKRIWNLYANLPHELFDFTYIGVGFDFAKNSKYSFSKIRDNFKEILCAPARHYYAWHIFSRLFFKDLFLDLFFYLWMHSDRHFKYMLNCRKADILICSHPWSSLCLNKDRGQFFIYDAHNCEYLLMKQILGNHPLKSFILKQVRKIESDACQKSDLILVCSEKDKQDFIELYNADSLKIAVIPNGANLNKTTDKKDALRKAVIFIGARYKPNIDAVGFILKEIAPELREFKFLIVGAVSEPFKTKRIPANVQLCGCVSDERLDVLLNASDIAINPMFEGSGMNIKMLDYMSYGLPIISTECGIRGIETFGRQPAIISSPEKFTDNIIKVFDDKQLYKQMSNDGRQLITQHYNWRSISKNLESLLLDRLQRN